MMDLWGLCPSCERWFYCDVKGQHWDCPVCNREPVRLENRATMPDPIKSTAR